MQINIEIQKQNRFKDFFHKVYDRLEDMMFSIVKRIPERFFPHWLMTWLKHYTDKRIDQLKRQVVRDRWHSVELEKAIDQIHSN